LKFPFQAIHQLPDAQRNFEILQSLLTPVFTGVAYNTNYADFGGAHQPGGYAKDSSGFVHLHGGIKKTVAWVAGETILTLPAGARPSAQEVFNVFALDATAGGFVARIDVFTGGVVQLTGSITPAIGAPAALTFLSLAGITFLQGN
jgi:hypothetical protein